MVPLFREVMLILVAFPSFHVISTTNPPRAHSPLTEPSCHCWGRAGRMCMSVMVDCMSISAIPAQPPKLPSIWNGACASSRLGYVPPPRFASFPLYSSGLT